MSMTLDANYLNSLRTALNSGFLHSNMLMKSSEQLVSDRMALYDLFSHDMWGALPLDIKKSAIQALENDFAFQQGRDAKLVDIRPLKDGLFGGWSKEADRIYLNENLVEKGTLSSSRFASPRPDANMQIFDTIAHEGYHAYQSYALDHPEVHQDKEQLREWALNEGKYYKDNSHTNVGRDEYLIQPQERDAWHYGHDQTEKAFEQIEQNRGDEPGRFEYEMFSRNNSYDLALAHAEGIEPEILDRMESEMIEACEEKGINYDFGGQKESESQDRSEHENKFIPPDPEEEAKERQEESEDRNETPEVKTEEQQEKAEDETEEKVQQSEVTMDQMTAESQANAVNQTQNREVTMEQMVNEDQTKTESQAKSQEVTMQQMTAENQANAESQAQNREVTMEQMVNENQTQAQSEAKDRNVSMDELVTEDQKQSKAEDVNMENLAAENKAQESSESEEEEEEQSESYAY